MYDNELIMCNYLPLRLQQYNRESASEHKLNVNS